MKIAVASGKGGTGKTSFTACMATLFNNQVVADCDVDAANLNLVLNAAVVEEYDFISGHSATPSTRIFALPAVHMPGSVPLPGHQ